MQITIQYEVMKLLHNTSLEVPENIPLSDLTLRIQAHVGVSSIFLFYQGAQITDQNYREFLQSKSICIVRIAA